MAWQVAQVLLFAASALIRELVTAGDPVLLLASDCENHLTRRVLVDDDHCFVA
jgi:hypothetical protein